MMGLHISYFGGLTLAPDADPDDYENVFHARFLGDEFPGRGEGLQDGALYTFDKQGGFRAGSYSEYNDWREQLAKLAGYPVDPAEDNRHRYSGGAWKADFGPFWELIHFSDCDGVIGPVVAAKLAKDFANHQDKADAIGGWFADLYSCWRTAFETAADDGAVDFH